MRSFCYVYCYTTLQGVSAFCDRLSGHSPTIPLYHTTRLLDNLQHRYTVPYFSLTRRHEESSNPLMPHVYVLVFLICGGDVWVSLRAFGLPQILQLHTHRHTTQMQSVNMSASTR